VLQGNEKEEVMETVKATTKAKGRPPKDIRKERRLTIRFSQAEFFVLRDKADRAGMPPSVYLRQLGLTGRVIPRLSGEERQFIRQLIGMANNINQLAKACHREGVLSAMVYFENYRSALDTLLAKLKA
jgi:hypothetical protein